MRKAGARLSFSFFTQPELQPVEWCCPQSGCVFLSSSTFLEAISRLVPRSKSPWCLTRDPIKLSMSTEHHKRRTERGRREGEGEESRREPSSLGWGPPRAGRFSGIQPTSHQGCMSPAGALGASKTALGKAGKIPADL